MAPQQKHNGKDKGKKKPPSHFDPFVGSRSVEGLDDRTFDGFLSEKDVTMVMFYDPNDPQCEWSKKHLLKAAKTTSRDNHGYAAVNCIEQADLCAAEGINTYPTFKLFTGTKQVEKYAEPRNMTYHTIKAFVENMPSIPDPPPPVCHSFKR